MKRNALRDKLSEREQTLLGILKIVREVEDRETLTSVVYIAQAVKCIKPSYDFRIEDAYLPFSPELSYDIEDLERKGYVGHRSLVLTERGKKVASTDLVRRRLNEIKKIRPEEIDAIAQLTYLYVETKLPKKKILQMSPTLFTVGKQKTEEFIRFLDKFLEKP